MSREHGNLRKLAGPDEHDPLQPKPLRTLEKCLVFFTGLPEQT